MICEHSTTAAAAIASLAASAAAVPVARAAPDLPIISELSFDEAVAQHQTSTALILLVATEQYTAEDWERSVWNQPELTDYITGRRIPVVYADTTADAAAVWLLEVDRLPAAIYFSNGVERGRRYGLDGRDTAADTMVRWLEATRRGSSLSKELRRQIEENPDNMQLRSELIHELNTEGDGAGVTEQICWLLNHSDIYHQTVQAEQDYSEDRFRTGVLHFVGGLLERVGNTLSQVFHSVRPEDRWQQLEARLNRPVGPQTNAENENARSLAHILELQQTLAARVANDTASDLDRFVLNALNASEDELSDMFDNLRAEQPISNP